MSHWQNKKTGQIVIQDTNPGTDEEWKQIYEKLNGARERLGLSRKVDATAILQSGIDHIRQREALRDTKEGERSMGKAVAIFAAWTGVELTEGQGWRFMMALKQARESQGGFCLDDWQDMAAYAALAGECESRKTE
jgi:hypothetical protein